MKVKFSSLQVLDNYGKGYADGEEKGFNDGLKTGNEQGYNSALERLETTDITANGTYTPNDIGFKKVVVNVPDLNGDYTTGYNDGYSKGNTDGYSQGYDKGNTDGYNNGYTKGENVGYTNGYTQGNTDGFNSGYTQGESVGQENGYNNALSKLDELTITQNGEYVPSEDKIGFSKVVVEVEDTNGSYADGYNDGIAQGSQKIKDMVSGVNYDLNPQELEGLTEIGSYAFYYNRYVQNVKLPESVKKIGANCFYYSNLKKLDTGNGVEEIAGSACYSCEYLTHLVIGENVKSIGANAFYRCLKLSEIKYNAISCNNLKSDVFNAGGISSENCTLIIGNKVEKIPQRLFSSTTSQPFSVTNVQFEENSVCTMIDWYAFENASKLTSITIPNGVTVIGGNAFYNCTNLTTLTIPASITTLASQSLRIGSASNKATITFLSTTPPTIATNTFNKSYLNQIIVPKGYGEVYKSSTNWSALADYIIESET